MLEPKRALVQPRVLSPRSGTALPLEEEVLPFVEAGARGLIQLIGPSGSGKTMALGHLAAVLPSQAQVTFADGSPLAILKERNRQNERLVIFADRVPWRESCLAMLRLAPWSEDEWIEYLLAAHRERCGSVIARLRSAPDRGSLPPLPELWRIVLDELAEDETVSCVRHALQRFLTRELADAKRQQAARELCLEFLLKAGLVCHHLEDRLRHLQCSAQLVHVLRHEAVQVLLAAEQIVRDLRTAAPCRYLEQRLPRALVQETATAAAGVPEALATLQKRLASPPGLQPMAASILHATDTGWAPPNGAQPTLSGAYLEGIAWPYLDLSWAQLKDADLSHAYLHEAKLGWTSAARCVLRQACLQGAVLEQFGGTESDLSHADLARAKAERARFNKANLEQANLEGAVLRGASFAGANLAGASFVEADLSRTVLRGAVITEADFSGANLEEADLSGLQLRVANFAGARFPSAHLHGCDLEYLQLPCADFRGAYLKGAYLTGSWMPEANFQNARLCNAGLADVNWAGVNLRGADLRGASFHAGSSRSGLVFSPIASEGSRTGFYTDDSEEQYFKSPEEIRKANLCGADLRDANVKGVDFYLVDLRGAQYDPCQEKHFRSCRAILEAQV